MPPSSMLHVRIDDALKTEAVATLERMGLSVSDAVRMLLRRVVDDQGLPLGLTDPRGPDARVAEIRAAFRGADSPAGGQAAAKDLDVVRLLAEVRTEDGALLPFGSSGTVVYCYGSGRDFEVEFTKPVPAVLTLKAAEIEVVWRS